MHPLASLYVLGLSALAVALPNPNSDVAPPTLLVCEIPVGDCSLVGSCNYCCVGDPGTDHCHTHGTTYCGENNEGIVYHCDDEH